MMTRNPKIYFPWSEAGAGQSFFVPTLDVYATKEAGLKVALHLRIRGKATFGVMNGKHGVLFTRTA